MSVIRAQIYKETRELLPWWLGGLAALLACEFAIRQDRHLSEGLLMLALAGIACGMGGFTIGHEYSHRTLGSLLAQPARRTSLLGIKLIVLASLLTSLGVAAFFVLAERGLSWQAIVVIIGCAFFLAPWLSMVGRSALAGLVFSIALPPVLIALFLYATDKWEWLGRVLHRSDPTLVLAIVMVPLWALGGILTWRTFLRLQALEGTPGQISLPAWLTTRPMAVERTEIRRRNRVWLLVGKELRLQQLTFAISAVYVAAWTAFTMAGMEGAAEPLAWIHAIVIPVVIGGLASAEERHLGTASWQALQPMASAWQWIIKAAVALVLTAVLVPAMPWVLTQLGGFPVGIEGGFVTATVCVCVAVLYVSSISPSGIRAILNAGLALILLFTIGAGVNGALVYPATWRLNQFATQITPFTLTFDQIHAWERWLEPLAFWIVFVGGAALLLRFGAINHRSEDRSAKRIGRQIAWVAGYLLITSVGIEFLRMLLWASVRHRAL